MFSCYVIGETGLTLECAQNLKATGHIILAIISSHPTIQAWANVEKIACDSSVHFLEKQPPCDYLFSVVNKKILPAHILKKARYIPINFHDSLLPRYAGLYATTWAILNNETQHGVSWHVMNEEIDTGNILKQGVVKILSDETAFSLNLKCYEKAKQLFIELIHELETKTYNSQPQDLTDRTYYGAYHKPLGNGIINWNSSADEISRLVRALDYGNQPNPISSAKLILDKEIYIVKKIIISKNLSTKKPGHLFDFTAQSFQIATGSKDLIVTELLQANGSPCSMEAIYQKYGERKNKQVKANYFTSSFLKIFEEKSAQLAKSELFWVKQHLDIKSTFFPFSFPEKNLTALDDLSLVREHQFVAKISIPSNITKKLTAQYVESSLQNILLAALLIYLYRTIQEEDAGIGISIQNPIEKPEKFGIFFSEHAPYFININNETCLGEILKKTNLELKHIKKNNTFLKDIGARYPNLTQDAHSLPISIAFSEKLTSKHGLVHFFIAEDVGDIFIYIEKSIANNNLKDILKNTSKNIKNLIVNLAKNPNKDIRKIGFLDKKEEKKLLGIWNDTKISFQDKKMIHELFEEQVLKTPNNLAVVCEKQSITYLELNIRANKLAHHLIQLGIKVGGKVLLYLERSLDVAVGLLAVLKAGGAYIPIEITTPWLRIQQILSDANPFCILTQSSISKKIITRKKSKNSCKVICLDNQKFKNNILTSNPKISCNSNNLAYAIYTSGSTGKPKGVLIAHKSVVNCISATQKHLSLNQKDTYLTVTALSFDMATLDYFLPLSLGAKLVVAKEKNAKYLAELIKLSSVTVMLATPSTWEILKIFGWSPSRNFKMLSIGEVLSPSLAKHLSKSRYLFNIYGPTEATLYATLKKIKNYAQITIGKPIQNMRAYVLDKNLQLLPIGFIGELHLSGVGLAGGYLNNPKLTREKFIKNPFSNIRGDRIYKTGDLVRWLPNGELDYIGRTDDQVKIRGFRIELGEIEHALLQHPQIAQATVHIEKSVNEHHRLVAFIVQNQKEKHLATLELQDFLKRILPDYMIPAAYIALDSFPLNSNGKIDKKYLLSHTKEILPVSTSYKPAKNILENQLILLWQDLFQSSLIGTEDNFFALGGDSILAMRLATKAMTEYSLPISAEDILNFPTISALSNSKKLQNKSQKIHVTSDLQLSKNTDYPLAPLQKGFLFEYFRSEETLSYQVQARWLVRGPLELPIFYKAFEKLVEKYDVFRLQLKWKSLSEPMQNVLERIDVPWRLHDLCHLPENEKNIKRNELIVSDQQSPISLKNSLLFRIFIIVLSDNSHEVVLHFHHIIMDGWSFSSLLSELEKNYFLLSSGKTIEPSATHSFSEYVNWIYKHRWKEEKIFWKNYLKNFKSTNISFLLENSGGNLLENKPSFQKIKLPANLCENIRNFSKQYQITLSTFFQGLWGILLYRYIQEEEICFGTVASGRSINMPDIQKRIGLFANTIPLRLFFDKKISSSDYFKKLQKLFSKIISYGHTPLSYIQEWSKTESYSRALFDTMVVFENYPKKIEKRSDTYFSDLDFWDPTQYILTFSIIPDKIITIKLGYDAAQLKASVAEMIINHLQTLILGILENPEQSVSQLPFFIPKKNQPKKNLYGLSKTSKYKIPLKLFEEQAEKIPNVIAIVYGDYSITYKKLNDHSNQLAHYLREKDVLSESSVAVCMYPSPTIIISLLAIWKAGGVYLPLDPDHPYLRINTILSINKIKQLITTSDVFERLTGKIQINPKQVIKLDQLDDQLSMYSTANLNLPIKSNNLAYILHTSGTTGQPKGVAQEHKTLANLVHWQTNILPPQNRRKIAQLAHVIFDVSLQEISYSLSNGYELHIPTKGIKQSLKLLANFIEQKKIDQIFLPTALLEPLCDASLAFKINFPHLTDILVAGEALKISSTIKKFFISHPNISLTNQYGPTETHVASAYRLPSLQAKEWPTCVPIGIPIDNVQFYLLDKNLQPLPPGIPGELYISGTALARSYVNNPAQTQQKFIPNPFNKKLGSFLYKTGDKVVQNTDGTFEYIGRLDKQLKIRGYRVEPGEIESQILKHINIRQCVVTLADAPIPNLIAYLVAESHSRKNSDEIIKILKSVLPDYMIPAHFIWLTKLPMTKNGKIDKTALPKPELITVEEGEITTHNIYEKDLLTLCANIYHLKGLGLHKNFFELGANSLTALRLILEIERQFNVQLSVTDLIMAPTVALLSVQIQKLLANNFLNSHEMVDYQGRQIPYPIIPLQTLGHKRPLFLIHPVGGTIFWFVDLARHMGIERPIYGIQDPGVIDRDLASFNSIEKLATFYLDCIRKVQPKGPYLISGSSFGSTVAFEIAKQLIKNNERIDFIGLLDGWAFYPTELQNKKKFKKIMRHQCQDLYERFQTHQLENSDYWINLQIQRSELLWKYHLTPLKAKLTLFKAQELPTNLAWSDDNENCWHGYSDQRIKVYAVPGDHETMFKEPNVQVLAARINEALEEVDMVFKKKQKEIMATDK